MRFRTPELFLGAFLTVAVFAMGLLFSSQYLHHLAQTDSQEKPGTATEKRSEPKSFWEGVTTDPIAAFTLALVIVGSFQAGLFFWQLRYMRQGMSDAETAAKAARDGAIAAIEANKINRENSLADQRPWVRISDLKWDGLTFVTENEDRMGATSDLGFSLKNFGKTPALNIFWHLKMGLNMPRKIDSNERDIFRDELLARKSLSSGFTVFPNETEAVPVSASITQIEIDAGTIRASFGNFITPNFWVGVGYTSASGDSFLTIAQFGTSGIMFYESGKDRPIHQMSTYAT